MNVRRHPATSGDAGNSFASKEFSTLGQLDAVGSEGTPIEATCGILVAPTRLVHSLSFKIITVGPG